MIVAVNVLKVQQTVNMMLGVPESASCEMFTDIFVQCLSDVANHRLFDCQYMSSCFSV